MCANDLVRLPRVESSDSGQEKRQVLLAISLQLSQPSGGVVGHLPVGPVDVPVGIAQHIEQAAGQLPEERPLQILHRLLLELGPVVLEGRDRHLDDGRQTLRVRLLVCC